MRECPACHERISVAEITGPVVWGRATVNFSGGQINAVSPIQAQAAIKPGYELKNSGLMMQCPFCQKLDKLANYPMIITCYLSGTVIDPSVENYSTYSLPYHPNGTVIMLNEYARSFQESWESAAISLSNLGMSLY